MKTFFKKIFLFVGVEETSLEAIIKKTNFYVVPFKKGDTIYSPTDFQKKIGFVMSGECQVNKSKELGDSIPLNKLAQYDSFGIISVLSNKKEFPTEIVAKSDCKILFIDSDSFVNMIKSDARISRNVIDFLISRILFLNDKISTFSAYNIEQKLATYLLQLSKSIGSSTLLFSKTNCAKSLGVGRASLYRALSSLSDCEIIKLENKKIIINDLKRLERKTK